MLFRQIRNAVGVSWNDKVTNEEVRAWNGQQSTENTQWKKTVLARSCHMDGPPAYTTIPEGSRFPGRPRSKSRGTIKKDLWKTGLTPEEAEAAALNRQEYQSMAQCVHIHAGWINVKVANFSQLLWHPSEKLLQFYLASTKLSMITIHCQLIHRLEVLVLSHTALLLFNSYSHQCPRNYM